MIEEELSNLLSDETKNAQNYDEFIRELYEVIEDYVFRPGKRLASCSTLLIFKGFTGRMNIEILKVCIGIELFRHSILIHDDLADDDKLRRGKPTLHKIYSEKYDDSFGRNIAIFAGNILQTLALKSIIKSGFEEKEINQVIDLLNSNFQNVNESQILDCLFEYWTPNVENWYIMASKRAATLFKASLLTGALLANANQKDLKLLEKAAENIGYCFDIQDDIIDTYASEEDYGRKPGEDLIKKKKPLHIVYTYLKANPEQLKEFEKLIHDDQIRDIDQIRNIISSSGALQEAKDRSKSHAETAKKLISETSLNDGEKQFFLSFIDYIKDSLSWYG
ncbi:polyprenyl synthetase family protein [[Eubacterium] cellulosolvens]